MSTRAVFCFTSHGETHYVYKHFDGYAEGAAAAIQEVFDCSLSWELPRFEADEFAAAFVSANKRSPGGIRLISNGNIPDDVAFVYQICQAKNGQLIISQWYADAFKARQENVAAKTPKPLFYGRLKDFIKLNLVQIPEL